MAHTNNTPKLQLAQFVATDKPTWLGDWNSTMLTIDNAVGTAQEDITEMGTNIQELGDSVDGAVTQVTEVSSEVAQLSTNVNALASSVATNTSSIESITEVLSGLGQLKLYNGTLEANGSKQIIFNSGGFRGLLIADGIASSGKGLYIIASSTAGAVSYKAIDGGASGISSITGTTNRMTIVNGANIISFYVIALSGECEIV